MPRPAAEGQKDYQPFAGEPRVCSQRGEVTHDTNPRPRIPGHDNQLTLDDDEAVSSGLCLCLTIPFQEHFRQSYRSPIATVAHCFETQNIPYESLRRDVQSMCG